MNCTSAQQQVVHSCCSFHFLMTEWMCKYTLVRISRGGFIHKTCMDDLESRCWRGTGKLQELQNEINCMNDSRDIQDA